jgi:PST family polysaccharide transporter
MNEERNNGKKKSTRVQIYWNTLIRLPPLLINFIISILVTRILAPKDYGILGISMMLIAYANLFTNFGLSEAIIQKEIYNKKILHSIFTFNLLFSLFLACVFYLTAGLIAEFFRSPECKMAIRVLSLFFIITSFPVIPNAILRRDMNFKAVAYFETIQSLLMSLITLLLAWRGFGYWALIYGQLIPLAVVSIIFCVKAKYIPNIYYNHSFMKDIYNFGGWTYFRTQLLFLSQQMDKFIVGKWLGPVQLGFYDKALSLGATPYEIITAKITAVMFSSFSLNKGNIPKLKDSFMKAVALISFINLPIYLGLITVTPYFVYSILGNKWAPMIVPFQIILFGLLFTSLGGLTASLNVGVGKYKSHTLRFLVALVIFLMSCLVLLRFRLIGIAVAFCIFNLSQIILLLSLSKKEIGINWKDIIRSIRPAMVASLVMFAVIQIFAVFIFQKYNVLNMLILIMTGILCYTPFVIFSRNEIVLELIKSIKKDILKIG